MGGNIGVGGAGHGLEADDEPGSDEADHGLGEGHVGGAGGVINLTVHGVGPRADRALDPGEGGTWVDVDRFERVLDAVAGRPDVRLTFDDGNASDIETALPRLLARGLTAEFFVLAGRLGEPGRLTADGVRELVRAGMKVGSHGWAHRDWRRLTAPQAGEELVRAHRVLADITGKPVTRVAIPFGSYDRHVLRRLRRAAVTRAYTSDGGPARPDAWLQPRTSLRHDLDDAWIARVLSPPGPALRIRRTAARLVKRSRGR
ncbi:polysaccharide deacetylase family protein [Spirillospora sp. NPDC052269]